MKQVLGNLAWVALGAVLTFTITLSGIDPCDTDTEKPPADYSIKIEGFSKGLVPPVIVLATYPPLHRNDHAAAVLIDANQNTLTVENTHTAAAIAAFFMLCAPGIFKSTGKDAGGTAIFFPGLNSAMSAEFLLSGI